MTQVLHMLLFGRHPFLSPADMTLNPAEQMVKLIENTVKGQLQLPEAAEGSSAADLLRRILVPSPKQRYGIKDILIHPWFQVCGGMTLGWRQSRWLVGVQCQQPAVQLCMR